MAETKKYLDYAGLKTYHEKAKSDYDSKYALKGEVPEVDLSEYLKADNFGEQAFDFKYWDSNGVEGEASVSLSDLYTSIVNFNESFNLIEETYAKKGEVPSKEEITAAHEQLIGSIDDVKGSVDSLSGRVKAFEDADYITREDATALAEQYKFEPKFVDVLPSVDEAIAGVVYLVPKKDDEGNQTNHKDEYLFDPNTNQFEQVGDTQIEVDMANYPTRDELNEAIGQATGGIVIEAISVSEIDALFA